MITRRGIIAGGTGVLGAPYVFSSRSWGDEPVRGGQLRVALYKDLRTLNPLKMVFGNEIRAAANLYDNLTSVSRQGEVRGNLAVEFTPSDDARTWTFRLKKGVKFQDGSPLEAADVVATFEALLDPATAAPYKTEIGPVVGVKAIDDLTVRFELSSGNANLPKSLTSAAARIVSRAGLKSGKLDTEGFGSGPFVLKEFVPNDRVVMERNPNYHREGRPYLDRLVLRILPDINTQITALKSHEVDVIDDVDSDTVRELAANKSLRVLQIPGGTFNALVLYADKPPFNNPDVRMALRLTVDRAACMAAITNGAGAPADDQPISAAYEFYDKTIPLRTQNIAEARRLLKSAGLGSGFEHRVVVSNSPASREKTAIVLQSMAAQAGIQLKLELMDNARYGATIVNKGVASYVVNYSARPTEDGILSKLYSKTNGNDEGRWATPETERMLDEARASLDRNRRAKIYSEFQRLARDTGPYILPNFFNVLVATWNNVNDWPIHPISTELKLDGVWLSKPA
jgi:peptide/nickel transport system substrate-binding protein